MTSFQCPLRYIEKKILVKYTLHNRSQKKKSYLDTISRIFQPWTTIISLNHKTNLNSFHQLYYWFSAKLVTMATAPPLRRLRQLHHTYKPGIKPGTFCTQVRRLNNSTNLSPKIPNHKIHKNELNNETNRWMNEVYKYLEEQWKSNK